MGVHYMQASRQMIYYNPGPLVLNLSRNKKVWKKGILAKDISGMWVQSRDHPVVVVGRVGRRV